ncbi:MAG: hypothetical protein ACI4FZ_00255 [Lachnospiraceae bacterium]
MNQKRFDYWMHSIDDVLLEEAKEPYKKSSAWLRIIAAAACFFVILGGLFVWKARTPANPQVTTADLLTYGYEIMLPEDASSVSYSLKESGTTSDVPMAQAAFTMDGTEYICRALKTEQTTDISGQKAAKETLVWSLDTLELNLCRADNASWLGWYVPENQTQWCLSTDADTPSLLSTAAGILESLGYNMAVAPSSASGIAYDVFLLNNLTVAETSYTLDTVTYCYRTAATFDVTVPFADISGTGTDYETHASSEIGWCPAELYYTEGGEGKVIWFDIVPGLLYSLSMSDKASEQALLDMAALLYHPAQGEN